MKKTVTSRIAPSPSGFLHLGNAFNFLFTALLVDFLEGRLHLRIDDFDTSRLKKNAVEDIFIQLEWLGIEYDSGPSGPEDLYSKYSQNFRKESYYETLEVLRKKGHIFGCKCTRSELRRFSVNRNYPGICLYKKIDLREENIPWRIHVPNQTNVNFQTLVKNYERINVADIIGDFVVKRRDGLPAYQITSLIDDINIGVNLVVRGQDLLASTGAQLFLSECLNDNIFPASFFVHHQLIKNESGEKLSKSSCDLSLKILKKNHSPTWVFQQTAKWLNLPFDQIMTIDHLKEVFRKIMRKNKVFQNLIQFFK